MNPGGSQNTDTERNLVQDLTRAGKAGASPFPVDHASVPASDLYLSSSLSLFLTSSRRPPLTILCVFKEVC